MSECPSYLNHIEDMHKPSEKHDNKNQIQLLAISRSSKAEKEVNEPELTELICEKLIDPLSHVDQASHENVEEAKIE